MNLIQCRMARAALGWSHQRLARIADVPGPTVHHYLIGHEIRPGDLAKLQEAFEAAGVTFDEDNGRGAGVRVKQVTLKPPSGPATDIVKMMDAAITEDEDRKR